MRKRSVVSAASQIRQAVADGRTGCVGVGSQAPCFPGTSLHQVAPKAQAAACSLATRRCSPGYP